MINFRQTNISKCFGSKVWCHAEKAIAANCSAVREWDSNGTVFGYNHNIKGLYTYSFGLNTKELQPSGSLNFCYLNKPFITISTNPNIINNNTNINIIGRVYNILRVMSGQGSLTYE